jgi:small subunit ribosomal protein S16
MLKIRLRRQGRTHSPFYWLVVADSRSARDGKFLEKLGTFNPFTKVLDVEIENAVKWLDVGAQPSEKASVLLQKAGIEHKLVVKLDTSAKPKKEPKKAKK